MNRPTAQPTPTGSGSTTRLVDLSHVVRHGMTTYPGLPGSRIEDHLSREESRTRYAPGTEFQIGRDDPGGEHRNLPGRALPPGQVEVGRGSASARRALR